MPFVWKFRMVLPFSKQRIVFDFFTLYTFVRFICSPGVLCVSTVGYYSVLRFNYFFSSRWWPCKRSLKRWRTSPKSEWPFSCPRSKTVGRSDSSRRAPAAVLLQQNGKKKKKTRSEKLTKGTLTVYGDRKVRYLRPPSTWRNCNRPPSTRLRCDLLLVLDTRSPESVRLSWTFSDSSSCPQLK